MRQQESKLSRQLQAKVLSEEETAGLIYSQWLPVAVHVALTVPSLRTAAKIAQRLGVSTEMVEASLRLLERTGLAEHHQNAWVTGKANVYLDSTSPWIHRHHVNWRARSLAQLEKFGAADNVHDTSVMSLGEADIPRVKKILTHAVAQTRSVIQKSDCDDIHVLNVDFFRV